MPLPSGREFEGAEVQWGEKEKDWSEESCNYSKLQHNLLIKKKCAYIQKNIVRRKELWNTEMLLKILHSLSVLNIPNFKRKSYEFTLALNFFTTKSKDTCRHLHVYPCFHTSW